MEFQTSESRIKKIVGEAVGRQVDFPNTDCMV